MSAPIDKFRTLTERLYNSTLEGKLKWEISPYSDDISASLGKYKVFINEDEDADGSPLIVILIKNLSDEIVDSFNDNTIKGSYPTIGGFNSYWDLMVNLNSMAKRMANGADAALDEILDALDLDALDDDPPF